MGTGSGRRGKALSAAAASCHCPPQCAAARARLLRPRRGPRRVATAAAGGDGASPPSPLFHGGLRRRLARATAVAGSRLDHEWRPRARRGKGERPPAGAPAIEAAPPRPPAAPRAEPSLGACRHRRRPRPRPVPPSPRSPARARGRAHPAARDCGPTPPRPATGRAPALSRPRSLAAPPISTPLPPVWASAVATRWPL